MDLNKKLAEETQNYEKDYTRMLPGAVKGADEDLVVTNQSWVCLVSRRSSGYHEPEPGLPG